ncbi:MAG: DNA polymerase III subunit alpha, partial [Rhabdaerophilum calidifontis]
EAMLFSEMLQTKRALLEPGAALHLTVAGSVEGEDLRVRVLELEGLEAALARARRGIQLVVTEQALRDPRQPAALGGLEQVLKRGVDGEVAMTIMLADGREVDIKLPGRFALPAAAAATLAAIPGILEVKPF